MNAAKLKWFYLARYIDPNPDNATYLREVVRRVTRDGWTLDGFRIDRWMEIRAVSMAEARAKFERGEGSRQS